MKCRLRAWSLRYPRLLALDVATDMPSRCHQLWPRHALVLVPGPRMRRALCAKRALLAQAPRDELVRSFEQEQASKAGVLKRKTGGDIRNTQYSNIELTAREVVQKG